jgi:P4 family phage/plasmid primase-like protien
MEIYGKAVLNNEDLYVTEKHRDISPILIDIDLRFEKSKTEEQPKRMYNELFIKSLVDVYLNKIKEYLEIPKLTRFYVMEKPKPLIDKGLVKDGIHIVIPDIVTKPSIQHLIRKEILSELEPIMNSIGVKNSVESVVDEAVIAKNNWQMYGSKKPQCEPYKVTCIYCYDKCTNEMKCEDSMDYTKFVDILSIRNKYDSTPTKIEKLQVIREYEEKEAKPLRSMKMNPALQVNQNNKKNICDNLELVGKLVEILSEKRADGFDDWIRVGWCLRNIDHRLLSKWVDFSKRSKKFQDGECEKLWPYMKDDGLGIGTLHMWAKQDNEEKYKELCKRDLSSYIYRSTSETHTDIARVVNFMFKYDYVCVSVKMNLWYEYRNHKWVFCDSGHTLRAKISNEVVREYCRQAAYYNEKAANEDLEADQQRWLDTAKKLTSISSKLKQSNFKDNIMKESRELFYIEKFEEKLDSRCNLIGFENGVYDMETDEFRDGRPEDYISFTTGINYVPYNPESKSAKDMHDFLSKIFTIPEVKTYVLTLLSSFLNGNIREEKFHIWTGSGSNGKSKFIELFEKAFGEYCVKFPITLLTQKRAASNAATSELARAKGKRFASLQEPSEDEKLNVGLMKEISGGDRIQARMIYKEPVEFKPQFKMILCCNHLPTVPSDDGGTWRRIRVVEFTSKFCENPNPENPNEFKADIELSNRFDDWKEHFMGLLIEYYKEYRRSGILEPEPVLQCTREYQRNNDGYLDFVETELERGDFAFLNHADIYACYKLWANDNAPPHMKNIQKKTFIKSLEKIVGKSIFINKVGGWKGWNFKNLNVNKEDID